MNIKMSGRAKLLSAAGIILAAGVATTLAAFTDSGEVSTQIASGTIDLKFDGDEDGSPAPYPIAFDADFLAPGESAMAEVTVFNSGNIDANLSLHAPMIINSEISPIVSLEKMLEVSIMDSGSVLYAGPLNEATFADLDISSNGTATTGTTLTIKATLPESTPVDAAGQTLDITLPFVASQQQ
jgi:SipW-cognate class signal peptide